MSNYFDFVLCRVGDCEKPYLFRAPAFSHLENGCEVVVETSNGNQRAIVLASVSLADDDEKNIDFVMKATRASKDVKKVLSQVTFRDFEYEEDDNERINNN